MLGAWALFPKPFPLGHKVPANLSNVAPGNRELKKLKLRLCEQSYEIVIIQLIVILLSIMTCKILFGVLQVILK